MTTAQHADDPTIDDGREGGPGLSGRRLADPRRRGRIAQAAILLATVCQLGMELVRWPNPLAPVFPGVAGVAMVGAIVFFLMWFSRCRLNAEVLAPGSHRIADSWTVAAWFTPGVMWWYPRRITLDIWRASGVGGGIWLVEAWWVAWLAKTVGGTVVIQAFGQHGAGSVGYQQVAGWTAAVLAVLVIERVTVGQKARLPIPAPIGR